METRYGRLTVIEKFGRKWRCICTCGAEKIAFSYNITSGKTQSCGCLQKERASASSATHGMTKHPIYHSWSGMLSRCENPKNGDYCHYGARGIAVCDRWHMFEQFRNDMLPTWAPGLTLDRIDFDGRYEPSNCRWIPQSEQTRNKRDTVFYDTPWGRLCQAEAARAAGISVGALQYRAKQGKAGGELFAPVRAK